MKYRLIKIFPGSASLGTVIDLRDVAFGITRNYTNYPEFWELIVEKDYEIVEQKYIPGNAGANVGNPNANMKIISVKRLSDNVIFSIRDRIEWRDIRGIQYVTIKEIKVHNSKIRFKFEGDAGEWEMLDKATHYKTPLFTTLDGVDLFNMYENCFYLRLKDNVIGKQPFVHNLLKNDSNYIYFSTKEAAEKYILLNKPLYSLNQIVKAFDEAKVCGNNELKAVLIEGLKNNDK